MTDTDHPARRTDAPPPGAQRPAVPTGRDAGPPQQRDGAGDLIARQVDENLKRLYRRDLEAELPPELQALVMRLRGGEVPK